VPGARRELARVEVEGCSRCRGVALISWVIDCSNTQPFSAPLVCCSALAFPLAEHRRWLQAVSSHFRRLERDQIGKRA
jgi:hypothetical protein